MVLNIIGDIGSPCVTPLSIQNSRPKNLLTFGTNFFSPSNVVVTSVDQAQGHIPLQSP